MGEEFRKKTGSALAEYPRAAQEVSAHQKTWLPWQKPLSVVLCAQQVVTLRHLAYPTLVSGNFVTKSYISTPIRIQQGKH